MKNIVPGAFVSSTGLESITISGNVKSIGFAAFALCDSLKSVTLPEGITSIDEYMFTNYALTEEKMKKANSDDTTGGRGLGLSMERESENEME